MNSHSAATVCRPPAAPRRSLRVAGLLPLVASALVLTCAVGGAGASELEESRRELQEIQKRIGQTARTLEEKRQAELSASSDLKRVERSLSRMEERAARLSRELLDIDLKIDAAQGSIGRTGAEIEGLKGVVRRRLAALYKGGDEHPARILFTPRPSVTVFEDFSYWQRVVRHDRHLLENYRVRLDSQQENLRHLGELRNKQENLKRELLREQEEMARAARMKQQLLARLRKDKEYLSRELEELGERARRIDSLVRKLETSRSREPSAPGTGFAGQKGALRWPVTGRVRIPFGESRHPELGTPYHSSGIELEVADGRQVAAVWSGKVVYAGPFKGYGNLAIVDHGDGYYTLYAFVSNLEHKVGEKVSRGEALAVTDGREGRFYFEVRKGGTPLNPVDWLE